VRFLKTEPAAVTAVIVALLAFLVATGLEIPLTARTETAVAVPLLMGAALAATVRPVKVPVIVAGIVELFVLAAAYGLNLPGDDKTFVMSLSALLTALGALLVRMGVVPNTSSSPVDPEVVRS
jgi:hypothetical protein